MCVFVHVACRFSSMFLFQIERERTITVAIAPSWAVSGESSISSFSIWRHQTVGHIAILCLCMGDVSY